LRKLQTRDEENKRGAGGSEREVLPTTKDDGPGQMASPGAEVAKRDEDTNTPETRAGGDKVCPTTETIQRESILRGEPGPLQHDSEEAKEAEPGGSGGMVQQGNMPPPTVLTTEGRKAERASAIPSRTLVKKENEPEPGSNNGDKRSEGLVRETTRSKSHPHNSLPSGGKKVERLLPDNEVRGDRKMLGSDSGSGANAQGQQNNTVEKDKPEVVETKKKKKIPEKVVAGYMLDHFKGDIIKQDFDLFRYTGTHWHLLENKDTDWIKLKLLALAGNNLSAGQLDSYYKIFLLVVPSAPIDMWLPRPFMANFLDGTLHLTRNGDQTYHKSFSKHKKDDYLIHTIPLSYEKADGATNKEFLDMLERIFSSDPDKDQKIRAIRQMYGACLCPLFPHLFMLHGPMGTGKSTIMKIAQNLIHDENIASVDPTEWSTQFGLELMIGKLVNIDTDIETNRAISDSKVKKIEDRVPFLINRKRIKAVLAPLPSVHIFGANKLPPTKDGASGAHTRRWTFIKFLICQLNDGNYDREFDRWVFDQSPEGVLAFALEGLDDLIESKGHFVNPDSGVEDIQNWQTEDDPITAFVHDIESSDWAPQGDKIFFEPGAKIKRSELFITFGQWADDQNWQGAKKWSSKRFHGALRVASGGHHFLKGLELKKIKGIMYYSGIGSKLTEKSDF